MSKEYEAALAENDIAIHKFQAVRDDYRNMVIGDDEFMTALAEYKIACAKFDVAFEKEAYSVAA